MAWSVQYPNITKNICNNLMEVSGSGICGFNSHCHMREDQRPKCWCPTGYTWLDPNNKMNGCKPTFVAQTCDEKSGDFDLPEMPARLLLCGCNFQQWGLLDDEIAPCTWET
ncbi:hypothetical protein Nepgr_008920 [Nepenthes gracilis]|uniref:Uncharacterized protein n=1 Tax=Nepenthes gracilis TaxID=150966 RepID=A0AAD3XJV4_NEPGR|nr:hypothetical protein Nepgr_008920 [Nepenthes gracilis]